PLLNRGISRLQLYLKFFTRGPKPFAVSLRTLLEATCLTASCSPSAYLLSWPVVLLRKKDRRLHRARIGITIAMKRFRNQYSETATMAVILPTNPACAVACPLMRRMLPVAAPWPLYGRRR